MPDQIIIEGGIARHLRIEVVQETPVENLAPHLVTRLPVTLPVLPQRSTRYIHFDPEAGRGIIIVETQPQDHTLIARHNGRYPVDAQRRDPDGLSRFRVQLPYQYFVYGYTMRTGPDGALASFTVDQSYLFWRRDPIRNHDDLLTIAACPNVDGHGSICWGGTQSDSSSLSARIDDLVNNFFTTTFNEDLGHRTPFGTSLTDWEANSRTPLAYRDWPWWNGAPTVALNNLFAHIGVDAPTNMAELNPAFVNIPELPANFTVARAAEWLAALDAGARRRVLLAVQQGNLEATPEPGDGI